MTDEKTYLIENAASAGISIDEKTAERLLMYKDLVLETNRTMNLTAIKDDERFIILHLVDCLTVIGMIPEGASVLDVGTGGGLPGMVIALSREDVDVTMLDSTQKKLTFIDSAIEKMGVKNARTVCARAEELSREKGKRGAFDICVSRAVARLPLLCEYCIPFVKKGGSFIAMKGAGADDELKDSEALAKELGAGSFKRSDFTLPGDDEKRTLFVFAKDRETPDKYPRRNSVLKKLYAQAK